MENMTYDEAVAILKNECSVVSDAELKGSDNFIHFDKEADSELDVGDFEKGKVQLDGHFSPKKLQALAVWAAHNIEAQG
ncbi:hypothetical protein [Vibrio parahaemolyticus]|uniref:hypothetical protein n=1 Tax=Vibrio parahaemolyticus TaxID=670 RepID=UPI0023612DBA|nr:hypothetical protein [Vibrio parahaemolyticus]